MSSISTMLLTAGPRTIHPWGDRAWRIALSAQHVSGGSSDYWLVSQTAPAQHPVEQTAIQVLSPDHDDVLDSIVFMLSVYLGDEQSEGYLLDTHNISVINQVRTPAPFWELTEQTRAHLASLLVDKVRLGITVLDDSTPIDPAVVRDLRKLGFDVDVFLLTDSNLVS